MQAPHALRVLCCGSSVASPCVVCSLKQGELKGVDRFGNQYYESAVEVPGRHRWVVYPSKKAVDGSAVPPEWHGWLHHIGDETPNERPFAVPAYQREHQRNVMSRAGAEADYLPSGHLLAAKPSHFLRTGADAEGTPDGAYAAWHSGNQSNPNPNEQFKYAPKVERR